MYDMEIWEVKVVLRAQWLAISSIMVLKLSDLLVENPLELSFFIGLI